MQILSFNLYYGFDGHAALRDPIGGLIQFQESDPVGRIRALAAFLNQHRPAVAGIQELVRLSLIQPDGPVVLADFLGTLQTEMEAVGAPKYQVFTQAGMSSEGRLDLGEGPFAYRFEEHNALLVHPDLTARPLLQTRFRDYVTTDNLAEHQGLQHIRLQAGTEVFDIFHTHLEAFSPKVCEAQSRELLAVIQGQSQPGATSVLLGDLNSRPGGIVLTAVTGAGFQDADPGRPTCCQDAGLDNQQNQATERIDYVLVRPGGPQLEIVSGEVVLDQRVPRSDGNGWIWPSDHCGVLATLRFPSDPHPQEAS